RNPKPETRNPKPETRNPKLYNLNPKPETRNPKPETLQPKPETRNPKPETRNLKSYILKRRVSDTLTRETSKTPRHNRALTCGLAFEPFRTFRAIKELGVYHKNILDGQFLKLNLFRSGTELSTDVWGGGNRKSQLPLPAPSTFGGILRFEEFCH
ncbi:hypothetical protein T484DRAFT_3642398, partial [Baffinella frigidus]